MLEPQSPRAISCPRVAERAAALATPPRGRSQLSRSLAVAPPTLTWSE